MKFKNKDYIYSCISHFWHSVSFCICRFPGGFLSTWVTFLNISCTAGKLVTDSLRFCMSEMFLIGLFCGMEFQGWLSCPPSVLLICCSGLHCFQRHVPSHSYFVLSMMFLLLLRYFSFIIGFKQFYYNVSLFTFLHASRLEVLGTSWSYAIIL